MFSFVTPNPSTFWPVVLRLGLADNIQGLAYSNINPPCTSVLSNTRTIILHLSFSFREEGPRLPLNQADKTRGKNKDANSNAQCYYLKRKSASAGMLKQFMLTVEICIRLKKWLHNFSFQWTKCHVWDGIQQRWLKLYSYIQGNSDLQEQHSTYTTYLNTALIRIYLVKFESISENYCNKNVFIMRPLYPPSPNAVKGLQSARKNT